MADKQLETTMAASAFQKQWFADLRRRVFDERQPYALLQADVPFELFDLLEIPAVSNQWWASIIAAKRQAPQFLNAMDADGLHGGLCRYCSLGFASTRYSGAGEAPWGGLPTPRLLCARLTCDCIHRVFELWAEAFGAELFEIDHPGAGELPERWWELGRHQWRELVEPHRLAFMVATLESLVERLETISGRAFDRNALRERLELVNQQEEVFDDVRRLIATAPECPVRMTEQITNVMATQWVRGSEWAIAHARAFRDEVQQRVDAGVAACPGERARLMWVGAGLWHDTGFYTAFESSHRAVFVWSMYLAFGPDGYIRYGLDDPMAALASRTASFNEYLHNPPWAAEWIVHQAREHRIDGALVLRPRSMKPAATGRLFIERALEDAGIPVLPIEADVVDAREWDADAARADCPLVPRYAGVAVTTTVLRAAPAGWLLPFGATLIAMFALQLSNLGIFAAPAVDSAGVRHELYAARTLHRAVWPAGDAAQRPRRRQRETLRREARARHRACGRGRGKRAAWRGLELRVRAHVPWPDDLRLPLRVRQRAHRRRADGAHLTARADDGRARRDLGARVGCRCAARRRAGRRVRLACRDPRLRRDGGPWRGRLLAVLPPHIRRHDRASIRIWRTAPPAGAPSARRWSGCWR